MASRDEAFTVNEPNQNKKRFYKKSTFVTHLPERYLYSPSHGWVCEIEEGLWRVGLTKFATRMLGDMVDQDFEVKSDDTVQFGQIIGWMEGFKAISDLYALVEGTFDQVNPALNSDLSAITKDPYASGWLYQARGKIDPRCMSVTDYTELLDATIEKILEQQKQEDEESS